MQRLRFLLKHELLLNYRQRAEMLQPLLFFVIVVALFPLAVSPDQHALQIIAPGIIWMAALLATLLSFEKMFTQDFEDGSVEQWLVSRQSLIRHVLAKVMSHWLSLCLPLIIITPLLALILHLSFAATGILVLSLLLGTPSLSLIGAIGAALTLGLRQGGVLLALIVLPLNVPVLIFGASALNAVLANASAKADLIMLGAIFVLALTLAPLAIAGALRVSVNN